jgi:hypothetical protein
MDLGTPPDPGGEFFASLINKGITEEEYRFSYLLTILISFPAGT